MTHVPLLQQRYHLACLKSALEQPAVAALRDLLRSADDLGHLGFQHFLQRFLEQPLEQNTLLAQQGFNGDDERITLGKWWSWQSGPRRGRLVSTINLLP